MRLYIFLIMTMSHVISLAQSSDLFFSEYIEGSRYNKALEIYNGTGFPVDLSRYRIEQDNSGNDTFAVGIDLYGRLENEDVFVITRPSADLLMVSVADTLSGSVTNFNGDDQLRLLRDSVEIDRIGISGDMDFAKDVTCVRKSHIKAPRAGEQDPRNNGEWLVFEKDYFDNLGQHSVLDSLVESINSERADHFLLFSVSPNPCNAQTTIRFYIPAAFSMNSTELTIYDRMGRQVDKVLQKHLPQGKYEIPWNARGLSSGLYFVSLSNKHFYKVTRLVLIK